MIIFIVVQLDIRVMLNIQDVKKVFNNRRMLFVLVVRLKMIEISK